MSSLSLNSLCFSYSSIPVLVDVDLQLGSGWSGVVGPNGSGKSTLFRLIAGELEPQSGSLTTDPHPATIEYCEQSVEERSEQVTALAQAVDGNARRLHGMLELDPGDLDRWSTLSPGERKRWQIGAALWAEPHILLLDEPTNHLDRSATELLLNALQRFRGIGLVISHDRSLLNVLPQRIVRLRRGDVSLWKGSYDQARADWEQLDQTAVDEYRSARRHERKTRAELGDLRRARDHAERKISSKSRMKNARDRDGRSMNAKRRARDGEASVARRVHVTRAKHDRAAAAVDAAEIHRSLGRSFFVDYERAPKPTLFRLRRDTLTAGDHIVLYDVDVEIGREDRIHLAGANGAGKSTLLKALLAEATIPESRCLYLPQELEEAEAQQLLADVRALEREPRGRVLSSVAALGVDPAQLLATECPSPGEARKLAISIGLGCEAWCLALDEPTHHLDLPSIERLEEALVHFPGALILISHDPEMAGRVTTKTWTIEHACLTVTEHSAASDSPS